MDQLVSALGIICMAVAFAIVWIGFAAGLGIAHALDRANIRVTFAVGALPTKDPDNANRASDAS